MTAVKARHPGPGAAGAGERPPVAGWRIWQSDEGRWRTVRTGAAARCEKLEHGTEPPVTVDADSETQLRAVLGGYRDAAA